MYIFEHDLSARGWILRRGPSEFVQLKYPHARITHARNNTFRNRAYAEYFLSFLISEETRVRARYLVKRFAELLLIK